MPNDTLYYKTMPSQVGYLRLIASSKGLCAVLFDDGKKSRMSDVATLTHDDNHPLLLKAQAQLNEYFAGKRTVFDIALDPKGTLFQLKAWKELQKIPYGQTISYKEQAMRVGDAKKARAVGIANSRNPLSIIIPCHRVIGSSGALVGFGGGLANKKSLLELEMRKAA